MLVLDHIGVAVADPVALKQLFAILGMATSHEETVPAEGVRTHFLPFSIEGEGHVELLEALTPDAAVAKFLEKRGPGVHHLAFKVGRGELEPLCDRIRQAGFRLIYETPRPGAQGMRINFVHPASAGGVLMELMEPAVS